MLILPPLIHYDNECIVSVENSKYEGPKTLVTVPTLTYMENGSNFSSV